MTNIKPKKWRYKASKKIREFIARKEGSDFAEQNKQFGGDAIGAKETEFTNIIGDRGKYFTQGELDALFSTYYNSRVDTFRNRFLPLMDRYARDNSEENLNLLKNSILSRYELSARKYKNGIRKRAAEEVAMMGDSSYRLPDSRTVIFPKTQTVQAVPDTIQVSPVQPQVEIKPLTIEQKQAPVTGMNQQDVWNIFDKGATIQGNMPKPMLPDIGELVSDGKNKYFADMLGLSSLYDTGNLNYEFAPFMISAKNGKLPRFEGGYAPVANIPEVVVTPDPNLRKQVNETWPDKEVREQVLKEIGTYKKTAEREYYYGDQYPSPEFYGDASKTAGGISYIWEGGRGLPANYEIQRAMNLVKQAGYPDVYVFRDKGGVDNTTNRSFYKWRLVKGIDEPGIHISTADSTDPYFSELAHAYAEYNNLDRDAKWVKHNPNDLDYLIKEGIEPFGDRFGNAQARRYLLDPDRWKYLLYDPTTHAEGNFRNLMGVVLKEDVPLNNRHWKDGKLPGYSNGKIRIKPSKRGTFTAAAKKHGASVREFESRVLKNPEKYSKAMVKKARFSRNARSWKH